MWYVKALLIQTMRQIIHLFGFPLVNILGYHELAGNNG